MSKNLESPVAISYKHIKKHGFKSFVGASLTYFGRKLSPSLDMHSLDNYAGTLPPLPPPSEDKTENNDLASSSQEQTQTAIGEWLLDYYISSEDREQTATLNAKFLNESEIIVKDVLWVIPDFRSLNNGGPNTLLRFAHYFAKQGIKSTIYIYNSQIHFDELDLLNQIKQLFGETTNLKVICHPYWRKLEPSSLPTSDVVIASTWISAYTVAKYHNTKAKFYFIQDYEKLFYPAGTEYLLADQTYRLGLIGIFNTPGLQKAIQQDHHIHGIAFKPSVDKDIFYLNNSLHSEKNSGVFFYGRPDVARNCYDLGMSALHMIKQHFPDTRIFIAGHQDKYVKSSIGFEFLEYMPYHKTGDLYRDCMAILGFMATPHPSYPPMQAMACGAIPISSWNPYNEWILQDNVTSCVTAPSPQNIFEAFKKIKTNDDFRMNLQLNAHKLLDSYSWESEMQKIYNFVISRNE